MFDKICIKCKKLYQSISIASKICPNCKISKKDYYQKNKKIRKEYQKKYREKNKEKLNKYYQARAEKLRRFNEDKKERVEAIKQGYIKNRYILRQGKLIKLPKT